MNAVAHPSARKRVARSGTRPQSSGARPLNSARAVGRVHGATERACVKTVASAAQVSRPGEVGRSLPYNDIASRRSVSMNTTTMRGGELSGGTTTGSVTMTASWSSTPSTGAVNDSETSWPSHGDRSTRMGRMIPSGGSTSASAWGASSPTVSSIWTVCRFVLRRGRQPLVEPTPLRTAGWHRVEPRATG